MHIRKMFETKNPLYDNVLASNLTFSLVRCLDSMPYVIKFNGKINAKIIEIMPDTELLSFELLFGLSLLEVGYGSSYICKPSIIVQTTIQIIPNMWKYFNF